MAVSATMVKGPPSNPDRPVRPMKRLLVNDENLRRMFGMDMWAMFQYLAKQFGYDLEG